MSLRILHTADNHIGISFAQYPDLVRDRLLEERFSALERLVATANQRDTHFLVVAGDLFDKQNVSKGQIELAVEILAKFQGEHVLVLAGNHDYYEGAENKLWRWFRNACEGTCVLPLTDPTTKEFEGDDFRVRFYVCPCPSKHSKEHTIGWVADTDKESEVIHIGIAHGNVEGLGLDADQRYFNMSEEDMRGAGVHTWLLGHIHVPAPAPGTTGRPLYFMPGIHTPDSVKCTHPGHAWWIELGTDGSCRHEQLTSGGVRFVRLRRSLENAAEITNLRVACESFDAPNTVLDLQLTGRLKEDELSELNQLLDGMKSRFLHLTREQDIAQVLDAAGIAKRFPDGTLPNKLLLGLLADESNAGDAHLALDIIETLHS
jgi:DNA repair exonuclease SbcCD nuclease subunit